MEFKKLEHTLLTVREAASFLGLSERTVWEITGPRGDLPAIRIGRSVRYSRADLSDYIDRHRISGGCSDRGQE